jgi:hypothetical protein
MTADIINKKIMLEKMLIFEGDNSAENIVFSMDKYIDGIDITLFSAYAKTENLENLNKIPIIFAVNGDSITFTLTITRAMAKAGILKVQFVFENLTDDIIINTDIAEFVIAKSIDADTYIAEKYPAILQQWEDNMLSLSNTVQTCAEEAESSLENMQDTLNGYYTKAETDNAVTTYVDTAVAAAINTAITAALNGSY